MAERALDLAAKDGHWVILQVGYVGDPTGGHVWVILQVGYVGDPTGRLCG